MKQLFHCSSSCLRHRVMPEKKNARNSLCPFIGLPRGNPRLLNKEDPKITCLSQRVDIKTRIFYTSNIASSISCGRKQSLCLPLGFYQSLTKGLCNLQFSLQSKSRVNKQFSCFDLKLIFSSFAFFVKHSVCCFPGS